MPVTTCAGSPVGPSVIVEWVVRTVAARSCPTGNWNVIGSKPCETSPWKRCELSHLILLIRQTSKSPCSRIGVDELTTILRNMVALTPLAVTNTWPVAVSP